jgi:hypothetical protein
VHDADPNVVRAAADQLARLGGSVAQNALGEMLTRADASDEARGAAAAALKEMGGDAAQRFRDLIAKYDPTAVEVDGDDALSD